MFDVNKVRADFPVLERTINGKPLVYLDNAATSQKPESVLQAMDTYYRRHNANIHRGVHALSQRATDIYERARARIAQFIGSGDPSEVIFTRGTTEAINLVAATFGRDRMKSGDNIILTVAEHHANIVPWQLLCSQVGAEIRVIPCDERGVLELDGLSGMIDERTRLVAMNGVSNALGTINDAETVVRAAKERGIPVLIDGAQAVPHLPLSAVFALNYQPSGPGL